MGMLLSVGFGCPASAHDLAETLSQGWVGTDVQLIKLLFFFYLCRKSYDKTFFFSPVCMRAERCRLCWSKRTWLETAGPPLTTVWSVLAMTCWLWPNLPLFHTCRVESIEGERLSKPLLTHNFLALGVFVYLEFQCNSVFKKYKDATQNISATFAILASCLEEGEFC